MRDFIAGCTLLACLTIFAAAIIAMIKPLPRIGMGTRKRALKGLGVSFGLFVLTGIIMPSRPETKSALGDETANLDQSKTVEESEEEVPQKLVASFDVDVKQFSSGFNALAAKADKPWRIKNVQIDQGTFKYIINDMIAMVGQVRSDGKMTSIIVISQGDGSVGSGVEAFMAME